jgi:3-methylcrotonyl-CoA carboxylase alpha subunit
MFTKLLIANRGEIACRVMRTARRMGIRTVAVFSEADAKALHVEMADEAVAIGPPPARESYLRIDRIIAAAKATGAEAIHPGYGFLSENPLFAEACAEAGIVFVGPPASAMRAMGSKAEAKRLMQEAGVPLVPGYHGEDQSDALLATEAGKIGYPVLIKASAGGGGRGMRAVDTASDFATQLAAARREAEAAFGDSRMLVEKYLQRPRHIEVQILGDAHGNLIHLGTRDCSIQRRHQKIVEEAPAPGLSDATREAMHQAAIAAARACGYVNAGTIEFIAEGTGEDPAFYFMEMNTRLQVEHPVTEEIYGVDLVLLQLLVAAGEQLPPLREPKGHAIEVRLCAEDPEHDFRPTAGRLEGLFLSERDVGVRIDTGYRHDQVLTPHYDNLIAKVIVHLSTKGAAESRRLATRRMAMALEKTKLWAPANNLQLLRAIVGHQAFRAANVDTGFIERHRKDLLPKSKPPQLPRLVLAACCMDRWLATREEVAAAAADSGDPHSPWSARPGMRLVNECRVAFAFRYRDETVRAELIFGAEGAHLASKGEERVSVDAWRIERDWRESPHNMLLALAGKRYRLEVWRSGESQRVVLGPLESFQLQLIDMYAPEGADASGADRIAAPIPGLIVRVDVAEGDVVARGQVLVVMSAMKTELRLAAPADGTVARVLVKPGDMVQEGMELVQMTHEEAKPQ